MKVKTRQSLRTEEALALCLMSRQPTFPPMAWFPLSIEHSHHCLGNQRIHGLHDYIHSDENRKIAANCYSWNALSSCGAQWGSGNHTDVAQGSLAVSISNLYCRFRWFEVASKKTARYWRTVIRPLAIVSRCYRCFLWSQNSFELVPKQNGSTFGRRLPPRVNYQLIAELRLQTHSAMDPSQFTLHRASTEQISEPKS